MVNCHDPHPFCHAKVNHQAGMKAFMKLMEAERSVQSHANALESVKKELDWIQHAHVISAKPADIKEHIQAAKAICQLHDDAQQKLQDLSACLGLLNLSMPRDLSKNDKEYIKLYTLAYVRQYGILMCLTKYQDGVNPVCRSQHRSCHLAAKVGEWGT